MSRFGRFTERAQRVIVISQELARKHKRDAVGAECLLGALLKDEGCVGQLVLAKLELSESGIVELLGPEAEEPPHRNVVFTPSAKRTLELAFHAAQELGDNYIGTEHILLGILGLGEGPTHEFLEKHDITRERVLAALAEQAPAKESGATAGREHVVSVRLDAAALSKLDALVSADVFKSRSEAAYFLIRKGLQAQAGLIDKVIERLGTIEEIQSELKRMFDDEKDA